MMADVIRVFGKFRAHIIIAIRRQATKAFPAMIAQPA
jgi:hypothetical protein